MRETRWRWARRALDLEEVPADDAELAFSMGLGPVARDTFATTDTGGWAGAPPSLASAEALLRQLAAHDSAGAVGRLAQCLGAEAGCLFEAVREPVVLSAYGRVGELPAAALRGRPGELAALALPEGGWGAICGEPGRDALGLALWGGQRDAEAERLVRVVLIAARLVDRRGVARPARRGPDARLVFPDDHVPGTAPAMVALYAQMELLLQGDLPVLLLGETGVGKDRLARILHDSSDRAAGPFVALNCAAIPGELLEAELFGIARGVATGVMERPGRFRQADGGTLFLDEIGEMPLGLQAKLLRALQEREVQPVGAAPVPVDIRVVAATNSDLQQRVDAGHFRRDLFYRLAGYLLRVPALRERRQDVPVLVEALLRRCCRETGKAPRGLSVRALQALTDHPWPGNVRELEHEVRRLVFLCQDGQVIDSALLSPQVRTAPSAPVAELDLEGQLARLERRLLQDALDRSGGNRSQAARLLGISRNGLALKLLRLGTREDARA